MLPDRRDFMRKIGIILASLTSMSCAPLTLARKTPIVTCYVPPPPPTSTLMPTCYTIVPPTQTPTAAVTCYEVAPLTTGTPTVPVVDWDSPEWAHLRELWYSFDKLAKDAADQERGHEALERLTSEHQAALDALVETGQLDAAVADEMQVAFAEAAWHVWRFNAPITCYVPAPYPDYEFESKHSLMKQAELLEEMAKRSSIDEATVAQARAAIERDIAYMMLTEEARKAIREEAMQAGDQEDWPKLEQLELEIPDECRQAAEILVQLLLGKKSEA